MNDLESLFEQLGGVAGVPDMAQHFEITEREARDWAADNDLPRVGNSFAFTLDHAEAFAAELEPDADDDPDGDTDAEDEDESSDDCEDE